MSLRYDEDERRLVSQCRVTVSLSLISETCAAGSLPG
jgi:hypothetical protein